MNFKLGNLPGTSFPCRLSDYALNGHILITGTSGTGKTYAMRKIEKNIAAEGGCVLVLDYDRTHLKMWDGENVVVWDVASKGIPFGVFESITHPSGKQEDMEDIVESLVAVFTAVSRLSVRQRAVLRHALERVLQLSPRDRSFKKLRENLQGADEVSESVMDHFRPLLSKVRISESRMYLQKGMVYILDLGGYTGTIQHFTAVLIMAIQWRYYRIWGQDVNVPLYLVCDEFQNLNHRVNSILEEMLCEGRKFNVNLIMTTQTLERFNKKEVAMLLQAATKLYFRPAENEIRKVSGYIGDDPRAWMSVLRGLRLGECMAIGDFCVGSIYKSGPQKLTFREVDKSER